MPPKGFLNEELEEEGTAGCGVGVGTTLFFLVHPLATPGVGVDRTSFAPAADIHGLGVGATRLAIQERLTEIC